MNPNTRTEDHIIIIMAKVNHKERILKAARGKKESVIRDPA